jgi:hypothetical protein
MSKQKQLYDMRVTTDPRGEAEDYFIDLVNQLEEFIKAQNPHIRKVFKHEVSQMLQTIKDEVNHD